MGDNAEKTRRNERKMERNNRDRGGRINEREGKLRKIGFGWRDKGGKLG